MENIGNVKFYSDDEEIIDILKDLPPIQELDNMNILRFIQEMTVKKDFGAVIVHNEIAYTIYKFDKDLIESKDAGLIMTSSNTFYTLEQLKIWNNFKHIGMSFSSTIFDTITNSLISAKAANVFFQSGSFQID